MDEKNELEQAKSRLFRNTKSGAVRVGAEVLARADAYCEAYKAFLDEAKTEREAVSYTIRAAEQHGYRPFDPAAHYAPGDHVYVNNRNKSIILATFGKRPVAEGIHLAAAHIDSPRLDLKPNPLYEKNDLAFLDTHYYGGVKKYQWTTIPLALHGRIVKTDGTAIDVRIGEQPGDPQFCVTDLLIHLSAEQQSKTLGTAIEGEALDVLAGSRAYRGLEGADAVKANVMALLHEQYGITEDDFISADLTMVPAAHAVDIGLDRSMIGAYGHDDRVCAYTALTAEFAVTEPDFTHITVLTDREEIGSEGNTGLQADYLRHFVEDLADQAHVPARTLFRHMDCLSADVNAAFDPLYPAPYELRNTALINGGVAVTKYTGARGKSGTSDAPAEFVGHVRAVLDGESVLWQTGELGRVDGGGGGTVAKFIANMDVDVVDVGVPVLSMHAPMEVVSKLDVFMTTRAFEAFYRSAMME